ncbi:hypothetical protein B0T18DRAFT_473447 [Schizothecium vesticola]|uniref:Uncharacterized protein n=1 Tax=Schizothecium vesticola TaxID=314040 RepID=A0AA40ELI7_9PEZI|nr:hypothetical protein B0T18DRAFT_473447 [Schizothecium vesticola]
MGSMSDPIFGSDGTGNALLEAVACRELGQTLNRHRAVLEQRGKDLRSSSTIETKTILEARAKKAELEKAQSIQSSRLSFLDLHEFEPMPRDEIITGQTKFHQKKSVLAVRPKFKFSITTKYPIRNWERLQSDGVTWDPVVCHDGRCKLTVTARAKSFVESTAELLIFGRRDEIHAAEIAQLQNSLNELNPQLLVTAELVKSTRRNLNQITLDERSVSQDLERCDRDRANVRKREVAKTKAVNGQAYLDVGSVSGYSKAVLALKSDVDSPEEIRAALVPTADACQGELRSAKAAMDRYYSEHRWATSGAGKTTLADIDSSLSTAVKDMKHFNLFGRVKPMLESPAVWSEAEVTQLTRDCNADVATLTSAVQDGKYEILVQLGRVPNVKTGGDADPELEKAKKALDKRVDVMDRTCGWVKAKTQPIAVAAALQSSRYQRPEGKVEAFVSIYRGEMV